MSSSIDIGGNMSATNGGMSRRQILQGGALLTGAALLGKVLKPESALAQRGGAAPAAAPAGAPAAAAPMKLIDENDGVAKGLNYHHDKKNVPANLQTKKGATDFKDQACKNCAFFKDPKGKIAADNVGTCQLFATGKVKETGWCMSWTLKPA